MAQTPEKIYKELAWPAAAIIGIWLSLDVTQGLDWLWQYRYARSAIELLLFVAVPSFWLTLITSYLLKLRLRVFKHMRCLGVAWPASYSLPGISVSGQYT